MSKAAALALVITQRVQQITLANGYATNIGDRVFRGKGSLNAEDLPCIVLVEGDETVADQKGAKINSSVVFMLEGHDVCDPDQPNDKAHQIIADLKRAVFSGDLTLDGKLKDKQQIDYRGRTIGARPEGGDIIAASIAFAITMVDDLAAP